MHIFDIHVYCIDDAVYLMLEYCPAGKLWDVVEPLVHQQQQLNSPAKSRKRHFKFLINYEKCMKSFL